ncbi:sigma-70 family RNA polymerase sigma factor [Pseudoduganella sp. FT25W]|uniref:Sigma-70 family RNA polymerase sigma factor n=1 Tax=Duganella alba TaxID=2666081 RepID=A0A6L5QA95_9BURK|nr:sigma-70 family RNA polymerase sigma factor [Duganella alba]MRX18023.1 sigma-70 family RNA polymerase sigma factor [Duganella alba]
MFTAPSPSTHDAFSHIYRDHHGWLLNWLWRKLGCRSGAADLAQDTFTRVLTADAAGGLREPRAYLSRVANNLLVNHWRHLGLEREYLAALASQPELLAPSPEEQAMMMETLYRIDAMLQRLSDKARQVFLMAQLEGLPYADIGSRLSISERMVKKYMAQAMFECALALPADAA